MTGAAPPYPLGLGPPDAEAMAYPRDLLHLLTHSQDVLLLFGSGRGGAADGRWVAEAGYRNVTVVDWDAATLEPMMAKAPEGWRSLERDILQWLGDPAWHTQWAYLSADPPSQLAPQIVELLPTWLSYARHYATITMYRHCFAGEGEPSHRSPELAAPPKGWRYTNLIKRSGFRGGIYWLVCERCW